VGYSAAQVPVGYSAVQVPVGREYPDSGNSGGFGGLDRDYADTWLQV